MAKQIPTKRMVIILFLGVIFLLIALAGCQPNTPSASTPTISIIPTARFTTIPTAPPSPTTTPALDTPTVTPRPTDTAAPSPTLLPSNTPTPSPWQIDRSMPFIFSQTLEEIFIAYPDGRFQTITSGNIVPYGQPWSPDGSHFIFWDPGRDTYVADLRDGSIQLLEFIDSASISWSPDGRYLLYTESKLDGVNHEVTLMLYEFETASNRVLVTIPRRNSNVRIRIAGWSPDSQKIAYVAEIDEQFDLFTIDIETMDSQQLTDDPDSEVHVAWSPIENNILVATSLNDLNRQVHPFRAQRLYLLDESGNRQLLAEFEELNQVSWSPDGRQVATAYSGRICILTLDTLSQVCPLDAFLPADEFGLAFDYPPVWSPDGQWLAFQDYRRPLLVETPCKKYYLFNLFTNELVSLDIESCYHAKIYWSPTLP